MNKFLAVAAAGAIALTTSLAAVQPSQAFHPHGGYGPGAALGFGLFGFAAGAIAANAYAHSRWYHDGGDYYGPGWDDHVAACEDAYRSYDPRTDTYVRQIRGQYYRVQCDL